MNKHEIQFCMNAQKRILKKLKSFSMIYVLHYPMTMTMTSYNNNIKTYRHEFSKEFMADVSRFSKVHQYDDRHTYKSEWAKWAQQDNIAQAMDMEKRRLEENGYKGDIEDKMFKAGRYYFRKKTATPVTPSTPVTPAPHSAPDLPTSQSRRPYITMSKVCIKLMDEHIRNASTALNTEFKPSSCYSDFYQTQMASDEMTKEIGHVIEKYEKTPGAMSNITPEELTDQIMDKIKKTYKNRYYKYTSSSSSSSPSSNTTDDK